MSPSDRHDDAGDGSITRRPARPTPPAASGAAARSARPTVDPRLEDASGSSPDRARRAAGNGNGAPARTRTRAAGVRATGAAARRAAGSAGEIPQVAVQPPGRAFAPESAASTSPATPAPASQHLDDAVARVADDHDVQSDGQPAGPETVQVPRVFDAAIDAPIGNGAPPPPEPAPEARAVARAEPLPLDPLTVDSLPFEPATVEPASVDPDPSLPGTTSVATAAMGTAAVARSSGPLTAALPVTRRAWDGLVEPGAPAPSRPLHAPILWRRRPRVRRVTRVIRHVDPWSVFKVAFVLSAVLYGVCLTAGVLLWQVAQSTGTIDNVERFLESGGWETFEFKGGEIYHNLWIAGLFAAAALVGLAVLGATLFNLVTDLVGGIRVSVLEEEVVTHEAPQRRRWQMVRAKLIPEVPSEVDRA